MLNTQKKRPGVCLDWMGRLHLNALDLESHAYNQRLTEKSIHWLDDEVMIGEILRKLTALRDINEATSKQMSVWAQRAGGQRVHKEELDHKEEDTSFDSNGWDKQKCENAMQIKNKVIEYCKYCGTGHTQRQYPAYSKICSSCSKTSHLKAVYRSVYSILSLGVPCTTIFTVLNQLIFNLPCIFTFLLIPSNKVK